MCRNGTSLQCRLNEIALDKEGRHCTSENQNESDKADEATPFEVSSLPPTKLEI